MAGFIAVMISACTPDISSFGFGGSPAATTASLQQTPIAGNLPPAAGKTIGRGPIRVALLVPLSGDPALINVGTSIANAAELAIPLMEANGGPGNISIVIKDTGATAAGAAQSASEAIAEGASLILGPLRADQVSAAGSAARAAGIPLIGFSNNSGAASAGVFLLNVLPEVEVRRSLRYAQAQGRRSVAAILPTTEFGRIQEGAFRQATTDLGLTARAVYSFNNQAEAENAVRQVAPFLIDGSIDALFIPDRSTAASFGVLLEQAGVPQGKALIIGSADWDGDNSVIATPFLVGAIYPTVDDVGYQALLPDYQARFGTKPHPYATLGFAGAMLANYPALALGTPRYDRNQLTATAGFKIRGESFRFLGDGRSDYALVIKQVQLGGAVKVDGAVL